MEGLLHCTPHTLSSHSNCQLLNSHSSSPQFRAFPGISWWTKASQQAPSLGMKRWTNSAVWRCRWLCVFSFFFCLLYYSQALKIHEGTCIQISLILILFYTCNNTVWHRQVNHGAPVAWMCPDMQMWKSAPTITQTQECFAPRGRPAAMPW